MDYTAFSARCYLGHLKYHIYNNFVQCNCQVITNREIYPRNTIRAHCAYIRKLIDVSANNVDSQIYPSITLKKGKFFIHNNQILMNRNKTFGVLVPEYDCVIESLIGKLIIFELNPNVSYRRGIISPYLLENSHRINLCASSQQWFHVVKANQPFIIISVKICFFSYSFQNLPLGGRQPTFMSLM